MEKASLSKSLVSGFSFILSWLVVEVFVIYGLLNHFDKLGTFNDFGIYVVYYPGAPFSIHFGWYTAQFIHPLPQPAHYPGTGSFPRLLRRLIHSPR